MHLDCSLLCFTDAFPTPVVRIRRYPVRFDTETADRYNNEKGDNNRYHPTHVEATFTSTRPVYVIMNLFPHRNLLNPGVPNGTYGSSEYRRQTSYDPYPVTARS